MPPDTLDAPRLIPRDPRAIALGTGRCHVLRLEVPLVLIVGMEGMSFGLERCVLLPDPEQGTADPIADRVTSITLLQAVLDHAAAHPERRLLVAGHTDTTGKRGYNQDLSTQRARNTRLFLAGPRQAWADHCQTHHTVGDWQSILKWLADTRGWPCDPGPVDDSFGPQSSAAREAFRRHFNATHGAALAEEGGQVAADWAAFYDVFELALSELMGIPPETVAARRSALRFLPEEIVGCGEEWPVEAVGLDGYESQDNRRVEVLFFDEAAPPDLGESPPGFDIYGRRRFKVRHLPVPRVKGGRDLWVRLPFGRPQAADITDTFVLRSSDGCLEVAQTPGRDAIVAGEFLDLHYTGLCPGGSYTLACRDAEGLETMLFADVSYEALGGLSKSVPPDPDDADDEPGGQP